MRSILRMPLTRLANAIIDGVVDRPQELFHFHLVVLNDVDQLLRPFT